MIEDIGNLFHGFSVVLQFDLSTTPGQKGFDSYMATGIPAMGGWKNIGETTIDTQASYDRYSIPLLGTAEWREPEWESDTIGEFLSDVVDRGNPKATTPFAAIYSAYTTWATENGVDVVSRQKFGGVLSQRGYADVKPVVAAEESLLFSLPNEIRRDLKARGLSDKMRHDGAFEEAGSLH